jgi:hypothetical protein
MVPRINSNAGPTGQGNSRIASNLVRISTLFWIWGGLMGRCVIFPIRQRRHGDLRVFRIRPMHRLGVVPQRLLREPLR